MSRVHNYCILTWLNKAEIFIELNKKLNEGAFDFYDFTEIGQHANGAKSLEAEIWVSAMNYRDPASVIPIIRAADWDGAKIIICYKGPDHDEWQVIEDGEY